MIFSLCISFIIRWANFNYTWTRIPHHYLDFCSPYKATKRWWKSYSLSYSHFSFENYFFVDFLHPDGSNSANPISPPFSPPSSPRSTKINPDGFGISDPSSGFEVPSSFKSDGPVGKPKLFDASQEKEGLEIHLRIKQKFLL